MTEAQEVQACRSLAAVLDEARQAQVERSEEIETWLADLLVEAWPRSAPLLEPAAATFGWENERGTLHERPAVAYLNARLRGLRFADKVQDKGHPLHKAWRELTREGTRKACSRRAARCASCSTACARTSPSWSSISTRRWSPRGRVAAAAAAGWAGISAGWRSC
jgi:hypothetical protein